MVVTTPFCRLAVTVVLLVVSGFGLVKVGTEFLPATDEGFVSISVKLPNGSSSNATDEVVRRIEAQLKDEKDVEVYVSLVGATQEGMAQGFFEIECCGNLCETCTTR